ncbi:sigma-70 family RNA polymerase sigma factor [Lactobacillus sp. XV13L]|nr:sigma-70 family RNA polymerase sigma factor [Lactobacillus sp. XV13L]
MLTYSCTNACDTTETERSQLKISKKAWLAAWANQRLVRGALKCAHVRPDYDNYEDLFQEGLIVYAGMLSKPGKLSAAAVDKRSFRKIIWRVTDLLRRDQRIRERQVSLGDIYGIGQRDNWDNRIAIMDEIVQMPNSAQTLFFNHFVLHKTISAIARDTAVSRAQLHRVKRELQVRFRKLFAI